MLLIIAMYRKITSHWQPQPLFSKKMAAAVSFSYKIGSGGLIFLQNWLRWLGFGHITDGCSDMVWILGIRCVTSTPPDAKTQNELNDDTNVTIRPFFFIWMYFIAHNKRMRRIHNYSKKLCSISQLFSHD